MYLMCIYSSTLPINQNTLNQCDRISTHETPACVRPPDKIVVTCRNVFEVLTASVAGLDYELAFWGTYGADIFLLDNLVRKEGINHLSVYESQCIHFSCHKTLEILIQAHQWYKTQLTASFIVRLDIMGYKLFMGWLNDGHNCSGLSSSLNRHFFGKLSRLKRKLPRSQELDHCVVRFKQKQTALAGPSCSPDSIREQHGMKTDKQAGWPVSPESREKINMFPSKHFLRIRKCFSYGRFSVVLPTVLGH